MKLIALCLLMLAAAVAEASPPRLLPSDLPIRTPTKSERWEYEHRQRGWRESDLRRGVEIWERIEAEESVSPLDLWHIMPGPALSPIPDGLGPHC